MSRLKFADVPLPPAQKTSLVSITTEKHTSMCCITVCCCSNTTKAVSPFMPFGGHWKKKKQARVAMKAICCNITDRLHQLWKSFRKKKRRKKVPIAFVFLAQRLLLILQLDEMFFKKKSSWNLICTWNIKTKQPEWIEHKELASLKWHSFGQ